MGPWCWGILRYHHKESFWLRILLSNYPPEQLSIELNFDLAHAALSRHAWALIIPHTDHAVHPPHPNANLIDSGQGAAGKSFCRRWFMTNLASEKVLSLWTKFPGWFFGIIFPDIFLKNYLSGSISISPDTKHNNLNNKPWRNHE